MYLIKFLVSREKLYGVGDIRIVCCNNGVRPVIFKLKMIEEDRYCVDISNQLMATQAILKRANQEIIRAHMKCCVKDAMEQGNAEEKIEELIGLMDKIAKN